ncbi:MAG: lipocalin family protein [Xanthomonadales bacterium]|jgi:apolipoprotein D and lipocalin family protein|nr:lipocalin family protein [Xanthomonadales bacterium]
MSIRNTLLTLSGAALVSACQAAPPPLETVNYVDLERFMGDWYVIANIPTFVEKGAHNAVESYHLDDDGTIATTFTFRKDAFDGKEKTYRPRGFVRDTTTNAEWGMQFVWPIKGDYRIIYLAEDYSTTIIGRNKRDYVWLMSREPEMPAAEYQKAVQFITEAGYDISQLQRVPQQW